MPGPDWPPSFPDLPVLDELGEALVGAAARQESGARPRPRPRRPPLRALAVAALLFALLAAGAAAATLLVLRGSVIPAPDPRDVPAEQTPVPGSVRVAEPRAADPAGGAPWVVRIAESRTGLVCSTVGQVVAGRFGLIGADGRFRRMAREIVDGCGQVRKDAASLVGARVFDGRRPADVRSVVYGVAGDKLRRVSVEAGGRRRDVAVGRGGVFVAALRGYPEDLGVRVALRFADGHLERHPFGASGFVVPDPAGGRAWKPESFVLGTATRPCRPGARCPAPLPPTERCVRFLPARQVLNPSFSEGVCGRLGDPRHPRGFFFAVRREVPGRAFTPGDPFGRGWKDHPPRTAVWGLAGDDVRSIAVDGPGGRHRVTVAPSGAFLAVYGPGVRPRDLTVRVALRDGRVVTRRGDTNLVKPRRHP